MQLQLCREIFPGANLVVCRVTASIETMRRRVERRELGVLWQEIAARVAHLSDLLDRAHLEDFSVTNEERPVTEAALEVLTGVGWLAG